jgi:hypothetical protein
MLKYLHSHYNQHQIPYRQLYSNLWLRTAIIFKEQESSNNKFHKNPFCRSHII